LGYKPREESIRELQGTKSWATAHKLRRQAGWVYLIGGGKGCKKTGQRCKEVGYIWKNTKISHEQREDLATFTLFQGRWGKKKNHKNEEKELGKEKSLVGRRGESRPQEEVEELKTLKNSVVNWFRRGKG